MNTTTTTAHDHESGFTLLEILLAVAVFAIVLAAINTVYFSALRLRNRTVESIERSVPMERTADHVKSDLSQLVPPGGSLSSEFKTGERRSIPGFNNALMVSPDFYTHSPRLDELSPWGGIRRVNYLLVQNTNRFQQGYQLVRTVQPNLLSEIEPMPNYEALMNGVLQMRFLYFDGNQWLESWDSEAEESALPKAIRFQLQHLGGKTNQVDARDVSLMELVVPVAVQAAESEESSESGGEEGSS